MYLLESKSSDLGTRILAATQHVPKSEDLDRDKIFVLRLRNAGLEALAGKYYSMFKLAN